MTPRILECLQRLYGAETAALAGRRVSALIEHWRRLMPRVPDRIAQPLTERDALLISYADQVRAQDQAPMQTLAAFCEAHLREAVSGVHILPFYPSSSDDGFAVKNYFAVDPALGTWNDVARLGQSFDLMFDAVVNHLSAGADWFRRFQCDEPQFRDFFVTIEGRPDLSQVVRPRALPLLTEFPTARGPRRVWTTFSADQVDLNFQNPRVLLAVLKALLFYAARGARFIRLDAIAFLWKEVGTPCLHQPQTHAIVQLMRAALDEAAPHVRLITETNVPHAENVSYFGNGANEAQLVYNFALPPLVLHSFAAGNAVKLTGWAQSLMLPSDRVTFFNFLASHDGIGLNPARGILSDAEIDALGKRTLAHGGFISCKDLPDRTQAPYELNINYLDALSNLTQGETAELAARRFLTAHAILLSLQGVPGIYFHSLFGSRGDRAGALASGIKRRINREKLYQARLEDELADAASLRARIFSGLKELLRIRRRQSAFHPWAAQRVLSGDRRLFAVCRTSPDGAERLLCLHNVSDQAVPAANLLAAAGSAPVWTDLLRGGRYEAGSANPASARLEGFQTFWLRAGTRQ